MNKKLVVSQELLPVAKLSEIPKWDTLDRPTRRRVEYEVAGINSMFNTVMRSRIAATQHLKRIYDVLEPKRMFSAFCEATGMPRSTANEWLVSLENAQKVLPPPVLEAAALRGMNLMGKTKEKPLGKYTKAIQRNPPPRRLTPKTIHEYLDNIRVLQKREVRRASRTKQNLDLLLKSTFRFVLNAMDKVPVQQRSTFLASLVGMLLKVQGATKPAEFAPVKLPEGMIGVAGRPRLAA